MLVTTVDRRIDDKLTSDSKRFTSIPRLTCSVLNNLSGLAECEVDTFAAKQWVGSLFEWHNTVVSQAMSPLHTATSR